MVVSVAMPPETGGPLPLPQAIQRVLVLGSCLLLPVAVGSWRTLSAWDALGAVLVGAVVLWSFWALARLVVDGASPGAQAAPLVAGLLLKQGVLVGGGAALVVGLGLDGRAALAGAGTVAVAIPLAALLGWLDDDSERGRHPLDGGQRS